MAESIKPNGWNHIGAWIVAVAIVLPVLYVLSIGPVLFILKQTIGLHAGAASDFISAFYAPLIWLCDGNFLQTTVKAYLQLWSIF